MLHADDFGLHTSANLAISKMVAAGELGSVSVIVTAGGFGEIKKHLSKLGVPVFLHFNLTEGRPLSNLESVTTLVDASGHFHSQFVFLARCIFGRVNPRDVWVELNGQYEALQKYVAVAGIDSHQHAHAVEPVAKAVVDFAEDRHIEFVRSYADVRHLHLLTGLFILAYRVFALFSARLHMPASWKKRSWKMFVMASWEKLDRPLPEGIVAVVHPGTGYDCSEAFAPRVLRHIRHTLAK